jgi:hypothetical protein
VVLRLKSAPALLFTPLFLLAGTAARGAGGIVIDWSGMALVNGDGLGDGCPKKTPELLPHLLFSLFAHLCSLLVVGPGYP